jgi:hypothetical protein
VKAFTANDIDRMSRTFDSFIDETSQFLKMCGDEPKADSPAEKELKSFRRAESVMTVCSQGIVSTEVAADHLMAFVRSITESVQTVAPWTCVRAILESSALGAWFLDPSIGPKTRVQRSFAFRFEGLEQQVKWLRQSGKESDVVRALERIDQVERDALSLGYRQVRDKNGKRVGIGQKMPSITDVIRDMLDDEGAYRLLSAMAHGHHWALQQLGFRVVNDPKGLDDWTNLKSSTHLLEKHGDANSVAYLGLTAVRAFTRSFWYMCRFFGWQPKEAEKLLDGLYDNLRIRNELRFWKTPE